jgi:hypothetical protein
MKQIFTYAYFPICAVILLLGALGKLPRVGFSTKGEGSERRYFYGTVWSVTIAQTALLIAWRILPHTAIDLPAANLIKLLVYVATLVFVGILASHGKLGRTRPILPGEMMVE